MEILKILSEEVSIILFEKHFTIIEFVIKIQSIKIEILRLLIF